MRWEEIAGHANVITILKNMMVSGRIPHSLLFSGPAGLGKMLMARILATALLCQGNMADPPCGVCGSCRKIAQGDYPDLTILANIDNTSLKIDQIRALKQDAALLSYYGQRRVFIIEEAQRLTTEAANSLLKLLEEPPTATVFILTAVSTYSLLPTIVSRCMALEFQPLATKVLSRFLQARGASAQQAAAMARLSGGRVGRALALLAPGGCGLRDEAVRIIAALAPADYAFAWETAAALEKLEAADQAALLRNISYVFRDLLVIGSGEAGLVFSQDIVVQLTDMAGTWHEPGIIQALAAINNAARALNTNASSRLTWEALLIKLVNTAKGGE